MDRLRIFISSTMKDLQPERDAVEKAISTFRFETVRAETIGAQPLSSREACLEMARECDIYIGIYGGRYGWIPPGDEFSVTEMYPRIDALPTMLNTPFLNSASTLPASTVNGRRKARLKLPNRRSRR